MGGCCGYGKTGRRTGVVQVFMVDGQVDVVDNVIQADVRVLCRCSG